MIELGDNRYGKSTIRLVKVSRGESPHRLRDVTVSITLEGDFAAAHTSGDNSAVIATDTMKNTVYALAPEHLVGAIEDFALVLARHFAASPQVAAATVAIREHPWRAVHAARGDALDAFQRTGEHTRTTTVRVDGTAERVESGVDDLVVMKTAKSAFSGFPRDRYTTLRETDDRLLATKIAATWRYAAPGLDYDALWLAACDALLEVFSEHHSASVQESIWLMGRAMLERQPELESVHMVLPNLHHWLVDLSPFGLPNDNEIFVATSEPYGLIEATVVRTESSPGPQD